MWQAAFCNKEESFEYVVKPFGWTNAPALFQKMIHTSFKDIKECNWYLHDIPVHGGNTEFENQVIVKKVLQQYA